MSFNKWIGSGLGWAFGGPIGGVIGFAIGAMLDHMNPAPQLEQGDPRYRDPRQNTTGGDLTMSLVVLTAALMKADGKVTQRELDHARQFFVKQFGVAQSQQLVMILRDVLKRDIPVQDVCGQIRMSMPHAARLQLMHYLIGLANSDGGLDRSEFEMLRRIGAGMGISDKDLGSLNAMFRTNDPGSAYKILEIEPTATDEEVKKAYRHMAKKYHPDKVAQLGEDVQKAAGEKFKKVQEAYETIQKKRGMN